MKTFNKYKLCTLSILPLLLVTILLTFSGSGCPFWKKSNTKAGSSGYAWPGISAPSNLNATTFSFYQINLSWQDNSFNEDGFEIERSIITNTNYSLIATVGPNATIYYDTSVTPSITYYYRVRAYMTGGDYSVYSNEASAVTFDYGWLPSFTDIAAGGYHSLARTNNGDLWSWGANDYGQLGVGDFNNRLFPTLIASDFDYAQFGDITSFSANVGFYGYTLAIKTNGTIWGWGANGSGQLGLVFTDTLFAPASIGSDSDWSLQGGIFSAGGHNFGLKTTGTLWVWGWNEYGQLGLGDSGVGTDRTTPTLLSTETDWSAFTGGYAHSLGIKTNGTLWSWGYNIEGQLGLGDDGMGANRNTPTQVTTATDWSIIDAGWYHSLGLKTNGTLWAWGYNWTSQLGLGDSGNGTSRTTPTQVTTAADWSNITASWYHNLGLKTNGTLWAWGSNWSGQLGVGDYKSRSTPTQVTTETDWYKIASGDEHNLALKTTGTLWVWGSNDFEQQGGQLGLGDTVNRNIPCRIDAGTPAPPSELTATVFSSSQIDLAWQDNSFNEDGFELERSTNGINYAFLSTFNANTISYSDTGLTFRTTYYYRLRAYNNPGYSPYSDTVSATPTVLAPLLLNSTVISPNRIDLLWQDNSRDETGFNIERSLLTNTNYTLLATVGTNVTNYFDTTVITPNIAYYYRIQAYNLLGSGDYSNEIVAIPGNWLNITVGHNHTVGVKTDGSIWSWGWNKYGQLGLGDSGNPTFRKTPTKIGNDSDWNNVTAGGGTTGNTPSHTVAIKTTGTLWSWGSNGSGQLGLGHLININTPSQIGADTDWSIITAGEEYTVSIKRNGIIWGWGYNEFGQLGLGDTEDRITPTQMGSETNWSIITAGSNHTIAIKKSGFIWSWGSNSNGQLGLGDSGEGTERNTPTQIGTMADWYLVAAGQDHTIASKTDGTLWLWGKNDNCQLGFSDLAERNTPTQLGTDSDWSIVGAGLLQSFAIKTNTTLWSWGSNNSGVLGLGNLDMWGITPAQIGANSEIPDGPYGWKAVFSGATHAIGIKNTGTIWTWGNNTKGQLGLGDVLSRSTPTMVGE